MMKNLLEKNYKKCMKILKMIIKKTIQYVEKYNNLLIEFNDMKIFHKQLKKSIEEFKKKSTKIFR